MCERKFWHKWENIGVKGATAVGRSRGWGTYVMCLTTRQWSAQVVKLRPDEAWKNEKSTFQRKYDKQCLLKNAVEENVNIVDITISQPRDYIP